jgi:hypothetical protein
MPTMQCDQKFFQYHATRLFISQGESYEADPRNGLPLKPSEWHSVRQQGRGNWRDVRCVVVLGEPGSGKSREFESWRDELRQTGQAAFLIALRDFNQNRSLERLAGAEGQALCAVLAEASPTPVTLFLDALDEGRLRLADALQCLIDKIKDAQPARPLHIRLSCRSRDWRATSDRNELDRLYQGQSEIAVIEILPLDFAAVRALVKEHLGEDAQVDAFVDTAMHRNFLSLAGHPLTLAMMLKAFAAKGKLGDNRTEIFKQACALLAEENNRFHGETGKPLTSAEERLQYAERLAALSVLSNRAEIHVPDKDDAPPESLPGTLIGLDKMRLLETLDTGLFTQGQSGSFRFLHPLLADFLAARWVAEKLREGLRPRALFPLLGGGEAGTPTPLRNFAAWLASFNADMFRRLLSFDPAALVHGDMAILSTENRMALVEALAERYADREFQREIDEFGDLACGLPAETLVNLLNPARSLAVRHMALKMSLSGKRQDMAAEAWHITADPQEDQTLRVHALELVCELAPSEYADRSADFLDCPPDEDPDDELAGIVLHTLYPRYLNTEQALRGLRARNNDFSIGLFRHFWKKKFALCIPKADEALALDAITKHLATEEGFSVSDPRPELFSDLLICRLQGPIMDDICQIARWVEKISVAGAGKASAVIANNPKLKQALIDYDVASHPHDKLYNWWRNPLPANCLKPDDFNWLSDICDRQELRDDVRLNIFWALERLFIQDNYLPSSHFERLASLAKRHLCIEKEWVPSLTCYLDDERYKSQWEDARKRVQHKIDKAARLSALEKQIPEIQKGLTPGIIEAVRQQWQFSHFGEPPNLAKLAEATSLDFASAAEQGFRAVWRSPPPETTDWNYPEGSASGWLIAASYYGLELTEEDAPIDWSQASEAQLDAAGFIALRYALNSMPAWFARLYEAHPERLKPRLIEYLTREAKLPSNEYPSITSKLVRAAETSLVLAKTMLDWFRASQIPSNRDVLKYLLRLALKRPTQDLTDFIAKRFRQVFDDAMGNQSTDLETISLLLAAWWLMEWQAAQEFLDKAWFADDAGQFQRIRAFLAGMDWLTERHGWGWPGSIPFAANVAIAPWLYLEDCPPKEPTESSGITWGGGFWDARHGILETIASGPAKHAREALLKFLELPQFKSEWPVIRHYLDEIDHRIVDEAWQPLEPDEVVRVLSHSARIVRNEEEFYWLAEDLCDTDLREVLRCDASLVPLLWQGTKAAGRQPRDEEPSRGEKPLQAILINQLFLLLRGTPLLHAREPEAFDAKKEDCRLQVALASGEKALIPIEIKQAMHDKLWTAPKDQLVDKYMHEQRARFGLYLVGWYGADQPVAGCKRHCYASPDALQKALHIQVDEDLADSGKRVRTLVFDCSVA